MIRLPFVPSYFPILLMPVWWVFFICFYLFYLPFYLLSWLLSPWSPRRSDSDPYRRRYSRVERNLDPSDGPDGGGGEGSSDA